MKFSYILFPAFVLFHLSSTVPEERLFRYKNSQSFNFKTEW